MNNSDPTAEILGSVTAALTRGDLTAARTMLRKQLPYKETPRATRKLSPSRVIPVFIRDGFIDRYSGRRLVFGPALQLISRIAPDEFPYHRNWKVDECHPAYWSLSATIDHVHSIAAGGPDEPENWVTTSMLRNASKLHWDLQELGWTMVQPGNFSEWDGLLRWFVEFTGSNPRDLPATLAKWRKAAVNALAGVDE